MSPGFTKNYLEIPTVFKHGVLEIKLRGEVFLQIGVKGNVQNWRYAMVPIDAQPVV